MRAYRTDKNQKDIVNALRRVKYTVQHLHSVGAGCPDILVGADGINILMEIKEGDGKLTPDQVVWHAVWKGQVVVVRTVDEALEAVKNAIEQKAEKKAKKGSILVAHNDTPRRGIGNTITVGSACGTDSVSGGSSDRRALAHDSGSPEHRDSSDMAKPWTRASRPKSRDRSTKESKGEE